MRDLLFITAEAQSVVSFNFREVIIQNNDTMFYFILPKRSLWETPSFLVLRGVIKSVALFSSILRLAILFPEFINGVGDRFL